MNVMEIHSHAKASSRKVANKIQMSKIVSKGAMNSASDENDRKMRLLICDKEQLNLFPHIHSTEDAVNSTPMDNKRHGDLSLHERLQMCLHNMQLSSANKSFFHENDKVNEIMSLLQDNIEKSKSCFIYISGSPGTGKVKHLYVYPIYSYFLSTHSNHLSIALLLKTAIVNNCVTKCEQRYFGLKHCYMNGSAHSINPEGVYKCISSMINGSSSYSSVEQLDTKLSKKQKRLPYLVMVDEIDFILTLGHKHSRGLQCVQTLVKWASNQSKRLILIAISNSVGDDTAKLITSLSEVRYIS
jgi:hypothetical protein